MTDPSRIHRQQLLREAEGYLDLITVFGGRWEVTKEVRDNLCKRAIVTLDKIAEPGGMAAQVYFLHGQARRHLGHLQDAVTFFCAAAEHEPSNVHVYLALAWCYKRIRRVDLAIESLEAAMQEDPALAILHYNLACYWALVGNVKCAVRFLHQAFDLEPNYRDLVSAESDFDPIRHHPQFLSLTMEVC